MAENEKLHEDDQVENQVQESQERLSPEAEELHTVTQDTFNSDNQQATDCLLKTIEEKEAAIQDLMRQYPTSLLWHPQVRCFC